MQNRNNRNSQEQRKQRWRELFLLLTPDAQEEVSYALHNPNPWAKGLPPMARATLLKLHHNARTGPKGANVMFRWDWNALMDGHAHTIDLNRDLWPGTMSALRAKVYREGRARGLDARTMIPPRYPNQLMVQAVPQLDQAQAEAADPGPDVSTLQRVHDGLMNLPTDPAVEFITSQAPSLPQREVTILHEVDVNLLAARAAEAFASGDVTYLAPAPPCSCGADSASPPGPHAPSCQVWGY